MTARGKLIAVEGIDGSGKRTQVELLTNKLRALGHSVFSTGFPQYDSWFGKMVGQFLNGELGPLESVDPHFTALLYAGDRFETKPKLEAALNNGQIVLVDRYIGSNLAHQTARVPAAQRDAFRRWIEHLEYGIYDLPREDLILYLRVPPSEAQRLVVQKSARSYTTAKQDILEASLRHLEQAAGIYDLLAREAPWVTIECFDAARAAMRSPKEIAQEVLAAVNKVSTTQVVRDSTAGGGS
jgi:dTMP kinase